MHSSNPDLTRTYTLRPTDYERWRPLHWMLEAPDVMIDHGGFDAVVGNPPFLGARRSRGPWERISGTGCRIRLRGSQATPTWSPTSCFAAALLIGPQLALLGLHRAPIPSLGWTVQGGQSGSTIANRLTGGSKAAQQCPLSHWDACAMWGTWAPIGQDILSLQRWRTRWPHLVVARARRSSRRGTPLRLAENPELSFYGCKVDGMGFVLTPEDVTKDLRADVVPNNRR